jgi:hypothetical protein
MRSSVCLKGGDFVGSSRRRAAPAAVGAACVLIAVTACGGGQVRPVQRGAPTPAPAPAEEAQGIAALPPEDVLERADEALTGAGGYRHVMDAWAYGMSVMGLDLTLGPGGGCSVVWDMSLEGRIDIVRAGEQIWVRPSEELWDQAGAEVPAEYHGAYVRGPVQHPDLAPFSDLCDMGGLGPGLLHGQDGFETTSFVVEEAPDHEGTPVVAVRRAESGAEGEMTTTSLVAAEGQPHLLRSTVEIDAVERDISMTQVHDYSDFGATAEIRPPDDGTIVDIDDLDDGGSLFPEGSLPALPVAVAGPAGPAGPDRG